MAERYRPGLHYERLGSGGKTKIIWNSMRLGHHKIVVIENKDDIVTDHGSRHDVLPGKAELSTATSVNFFQYLHRQGIYTHFEAPVNETHFAAKYLKMLPVEVVVRRFADGSFLKRNPEVAKGTRFTTPVIEFYYKNDLLNDPFMLGNGRQGSDWLLFSPDRPVDNHPLGTVMRDKTRLNANSRKMRQQAMQTFLALEEGMDKFNVGLRDLQVEFGIYEGEELLLGDVIDNDSVSLSVPIELSSGEAVSVENPQPTIDGYRFTHQLSEKMLTQLPNPPYRPPDFFDILA